MAVMRKTSFSSSSLSGEANSQRVLRSRFSKMPSARVMAVPLGASNLWMWCVSVIETSYVGNSFMMRAKYLFTAEKMATPRLKLLDQKSVLPSSVQRRRISSPCSAIQPVLPDTSFTPSCIARRQLP